MQNLLGDNKNAVSEFLLFKVIKQTSDRTLSHNSD